MATIPFLNNTSFSAKVTFTGDVEIARPNGATGVLLIKGGKNVVSAVGEINSELNFGSNDGSIPDRIGGSIKSVTEFNNGARVGMAFYTAKQGRSPVLQEAMRINYEGNVGIGLGTINSKLFVNTDTVGDLYFSGGADNSRHLVFSTFATVSPNAGHLINATSSNGVIAFAIGNTERMRIDSNGNTSFTGNVGMGSTGIYTALADLNLSSKGLAIKNNVNGSSNNWSYITNTATTSSANLNFHTGSNTSALNLSHIGNAVFSANVTISKAANQNAFTLKTGPLTTANIWSATNGSLLDLYNATVKTITLDGRTGNATFIGDVDALRFSMNPNFASSNEYLIISKLQSQDGGIILKSKTSGGNVQNDWQILNHGTTGDLKFYAYGLGGNAFILDRENGSATFASNVTFGGAASRTCTYDGGGGNFKITPNAGGWSSGYFFNQSDGTYRGGFGALGGTNTLQYFWIGDDYNDTSMVVYPNGGNVGIGTANPLAKLHLESDGSTSFRIQRADGAATSGYLAISSEASHNTIYSRNTDGNTAKKIRIVQGSTETLSILANGNVGIGESNPSSLLHVRAATDVTGTIEVQGGKAIVTGEGEVNSELNFGSNDASATGGIGGSIKSITETTNGAYVGMSFYTAKQGRTPVLEEAMRIDHDGKVGIGTDSPVPKFHIVLNDSTGGTANGATIEQKGLGDATMSFLLSGGQRWKMGADNSDGNKFKLSGGNNLNSNTVLTVNGSLDVGIGTASPTAKLQVVGLSEYNDNMDALANNLTAGAFYRTGDLLKVVH